MKFWFSFNFRSSIMDIFRRKSKETTACHTKQRTWDSSRNKAQQIGERLIDFHESEYLFRHDVCRWCNYSFVYTSMDLRQDCGNMTGFRSVCFGCVFWGGGSHALYIRQGTSDTPRPPKKTLLLLSRERWGNLDIMIIIIVPWRITKSFSLPYGGIPGFFGACWKAPRFLPWLPRWHMLTARESLEMRNVSNVELK